MFQAKTCGSVGVISKKFASIAIILLMGFAVVGCHTQDSSPLIRPESPVLPASDVNDSLPKSGVIDRSSSDSVLIADQSASQKAIAMEGGTPIEPVSSPGEQPDAEASSGLFRCGRSPAGWTQGSSNQWKSTSGMTISIYADAQSNQVPSAYFWKSDTKHVPQAQTLLTQAKPGEEINVTKYFRLYYNDAWLINEPIFEPENLQMPGSLSVPRYQPEESPYQHHYLYRPASDWMIDQILVRAQGFVYATLDEKDPERQDILVFAEGPYFPIYEGRFKQQNQLFWFSAQRHELGLRYSDPKIKETLSISTPQERIESLEQINDFLEFCRK
jgi:hypothetical protein